MLISLKQYKKDYKIYIWKIYIKAMKHHIDNIWGWNLEWQKKDFKKALVRFKTEIIILNNSKVDYVQYLELNKSIYINMIIIEPDYQSRGIGPRIIGKISSINPHLPIELRCFIVNAEALNFYLKNGFKIKNKENEFYILRKATN
ncbi:MAG: GNAT family N-acetyltransferase [Marinicellaceae bacterium]